MVCGARITSRSQMERLYRTHLSYINSATYFFARKNEQSYDDVLPIIVEAFMVACETWKPHRGSFVSWLGHKIRWVFAQHHRESRNEIQCRSFREGEDFEQSIGFSLRDFCFEISDDAATVVRCVVEAPRELGTRAKIYKYMLRDMGWSMRRIKEAFSEIGQALLED